MSIKAIFVTSTLALSLVACTTMDSTPSSTRQATTLTETLKKTSGKLIHPYLTCVKSQLSKQYPTASITPITSTLYTGKVPGTQANQPRATFEIGTSTEKVETTVTLQQTQPIDTALTHIFENCL